MKHFSELSPLTMFAAELLFWDRQLKWEFRKVGGW